MKKATSIHIRLDEKMAELIKKEAEFQEISISEFARQAIKYHLQRYYTKGEVL